MFEEKQIFKTHRPYVAKKFALEIPGTNAKIYFCQVPISSVKVQNVAAFFFVIWIFNFDTFII